LICLFAGLIMVVVGTLAFFTKSYRKLTELYASAPTQDPNGDDAEGAGEGDVAAAEGSEASDSAAADSVTADSRRFTDAPAPLRGMPPEIPEAPESRR